MEMETGWQQTRQVPPAVPRIHRNRKLKDGSTEQCHVLSSSMQSTWKLPFSRRRWSQSKDIKRPFPPWRWHHYMTLFVKPITLVKGDLVQNLISTYGTDACITYV